MTALLYISYSSGLSEADKLAIDKSVFENRLSVRKFVKKVSVKSKRIVISTTLGILILFSVIENVDAVGLPPMPQAPIMKLDSRVGSVKFVSSSVIPQNKITFIEVSQIDKTCVEDTENNLDRLLEVRGGDLSPLSKVLFRILLIWTMGYTPTEGFQPVGINPVFGHPGQVGPTPRIAPKLQENPINRNNPGQGAGRVKQNNQDGTLTKEQRRNLPSPDDVIIPEQNVIIRDGQAKWKVKNHGHDFGIESALDSKGRFKTGKTPENIQVFKEEIKNLVLNGERIEGTYRKSEPDGYPASHFYDPETRKNAIFKKETREFVSAWKLTEGQADDLLNNGNVGDY